jgi:hypothetical protein
MKKESAGNGPSQAQPRPRARFHGRHDDAILFQAEQPVFARVRVESEHGHWQLASVVLAPGRGQHRDGGGDALLGEILGHVGEWNVRGLQGQDVRGGEKGHALVVHAELFGQVAGVADEARFDLGHRLLGHGRGHDGGDRSAPRLLDGEIEVVELLAAIRRDAEAKSRLGDGAELEERDARGRLQLAGKTIDDVDRNGGAHDALGLRQHLAIARDIQIRRALDEKRADLLGQGRGGSRELGQRADDDLAGDAGGVAQGDEDVLDRLHRRKAPIILVVAGHFT